MRQHWFQFIISGISLMLLNISGQAQEEIYDDFNDIVFERVNVEDDEGLSLREHAGEIYEDEQGIIWTVISTGLYRFNGYSVINVTSYLMRKYNLEFGNEFPTCFYVENDSIIWHGARRGLFKINLSIPSAKKIILDTPIHHDNFRNHIALFYKSNDTLYVGTANGLYLLNTKTDSVISTFLNDGIDINFRYSSRRVGSLMPEIESGYIWMAMADGFYRINKETREVEQYKTTSSPWNFGNHFYEGERYDSVILMPSYGMGMVEFNIKTKKFTDYYTNTKKGNGWEYNVVRSAVKLSDTLSLVNVMNIGYGLFNRFTKTYTFLKTPSIIEAYGAFIHTDRSGYGWSGCAGKLYRTTQPIVKSNKHFNHIIDIATFNVNGILKYHPPIDGYKNLNLDNNGRNIQLIYNMTKSYLYPSVEYEYRVDQGKWQKPEEPNTLSLFNLDAGNHSVEFRALNKDNILAKREITFNIHQPFYQTSYFIPLCLVILFVVGYIIREIQIRKKHKEERFKAEFNRKITELEAKALRSQINPHFIFNTLNSIKYFALMKPKEETTDFITLFATLIRQILENSKESLILLEEEVEILTSYMEIEKRRLKNSFDYEVYIDEAIPKNFLIPPMIIQPFLENAIWHGLMHKENDRKVKINFLAGDNIVRCVITDNGVGRKIAKEISKNKLMKSNLGIKITTERMEKLSEIYGLSSNFEIIDLYDGDNNPIGTEVIIVFYNTE